MATRTEQNFLEWLWGACIYVNFARYGQLGGHGFVCVGTYDYSDRVELLVDDLDGGDIKALDAADSLKEYEAFGGCWIGNDADPAKAMQKMVDKARHYYFNVLNDVKA